MRKLYILIFALSLFTGTAFGQMVKGHVYDAKTHEPLPGVNITYKKINGDTNGTISMPTEPMKSRCRTVGSTSCSVTSGTRTNNSR